MRPQVGEHCVKDTTEEEVPVYVPLVDILVEGASDVYAMVLLS